MPKVLPLPASQIGMPASVVRSWAGVYPTTIVGAGVFAHK